MLNILVTGSNGQLGMSIREISHTFQKQFHFFFTDIEELDITQRDATVDYCRSRNIDIIINTAAYTAVDYAEDNPELCYSINKDGVKNLADCAKELGLFMVHISTDYVFDGTIESPYQESDSTNPISVYGQSKLEGELMMQNAEINGVIIRTSWLYSCYGKNFLKTIFTLSRERGELKIVNDQFGTPTNSQDLVHIILELVQQKERIQGTEIFHYSNSGRCTWYEFARLIVEQSGFSCKVIPIGTAEFPTKARRPKYSELSKEKLKKFLEVEIPDWRLGVEASVKKLV